MAQVKFYRGKYVNLNSHKDGLYFTTDKAGKVNKLYFPNGNAAVAISDYDDIIADLEGKVSTNTGNIATLTTQVATNKNNITTLQTDVTELQGTLDGYSSTNTVKAAIDAIEADIAAHGVLTVAADTTSSAALSVTPTSGNVKVKLLADEDTIKTVSSKLTVGEIPQSKVKNLSTDLTNINNDILEINTNIGSGFSATNTVAKAIQDVKDAAVTKVASKDSSITVTASKDGGKGDIDLAVDTGMIASALADDDEFTQKYLTIEDGKVTIDTTSTTAGMLKSYNIKQGGASIGTIDIPKDFLVKSGSIVSGTWTDGTFTPSTSGTDKALALVLNTKDGSGNDETIYINVKDLVDIYTGGTAISVSADNKISLAYNTSDKYLEVSDGKLASKGIDAAIKTAADNVSISGGNTAADGKYVSAVKASGKTITVTTADLPTLSASQVDATHTSDYTYSGAKFVSSVTVSGHTVTLNNDTLPEGVDHVGDVVSVSAKNGVKNSGTAAAPILEANLASTTAVTATEAVYNVALNSSGNLVVSVPELLWQDV